MKNMTAKGFLIAGRANSGKTLFMLNFAEYMGYNNLTIKFKRTVEEVTRSNTISQYRKSIVSDSANTTKSLQIAQIDVPVLKGKKSADFIDTTGISSAINYEQDIRDGMVQTLSLLNDNHIILHMVDTSAVAAEKVIDDIDMELYRYGRKRGNYLVLANKIDVKESIDGQKFIDNNLMGVRIIMISALHKTGFNEVKKYVSKLI